MKIIKKITSYILTIAFAILLAIGIKTYVFRSCYVEGRSMQPTLYEDDFGWVLANTRFVDVDRFDIVVIDSDSNDKLIVKRCIGLPNETIEYIDNKLYIDGVYYEEDFVLDGSITEDTKIVLGEDEYYCLGDNRNISKDSRFWGAFKGEDIITVGFFRISPFSKFGVVK